jgi:hypothetical protein
MPARTNTLFFKIDIQNFYFSIARMRVTRALRSYTYPGANTLAMWSTVRTPYPGHAHVLPTGFVQSPASGYACAYEISGRSSHRAGYFERGTVDVQHKRIRISAQLNGVLCVMSPLMKCTSRESRSGFAPMIGALRAFNSAAIFL